MTLRFTTVIYLPPDYAARMEAFQRTHADWMSRPTKLAPHVTVRVGGGLDDSPGMVEDLARVARRTAPFPVRLADPALFVGEGVTLYLGVASPALHTLHRAVTEAVAARSGVAPGEHVLGGFVPHATLLFAGPEMRGRQAEMTEAAAAELAPFPTFTAATMALLRLDREDGRYIPVHDFPLG